MEVSWVCLWLLFLLLGGDSASLRGLSVLVQSDVGKGLLEPLLARFWKSFGDVALHRVALRQEKAFKYGMVA
jgi:hypothetical protein